MVRLFFGKIGATTGLMFAGVSRLFGLFAEVMGGIFVSFYEKGVVQPRQVFRQIVLMGVDSIAIICLVCTAVGMVLALQAGYQLKEFGATLYTGSLVAVSVTRELGPLVTGIVITGRVGARVAAELGTMKVQEEVDALTTMGLNVVRYLVIPRFIALMIILPCLTVLGDIMGMVGGFLIGTLGMGINPHLYVSVSIDALVMKDFFTSIVKSVIFAFIIALISCHQGLSVSGGADGVGKSTTQAVVLSIILIIVMDCVATGVIYFALPS